ncbi:DDE-type integrase/transposase/recombinase [Polaribacter cellanae]|uniref:Transposase family protein n=1 Tax=Polaribacter cellanae TaxID=2818493 RepID=A0A975CR59_9FLAO|nr:DDE-type integrase/transposase/recombinase [Polaribacter cellanae]QTE22392.1 transposase family protein [Polaribacter cellanae]
MIGFVPYKEILSYGISVNTLKNGLFNFRKGKSPSWENIKDAKDKRKILINLDTIPKGTRTKYNIPTSEDYKKLQSKDFSNNTTLLDGPNAEYLLNAYSKNYQQYINIYWNRLAYSSDKQNELAIPYAKEHAYWLEMIHLTGTLEKATYGSIKRMFKIHLALIKKSEIILQSEVRSAIHFKVKLTALRKALLKGETGLDVIINNSLKPNEANVKITDFHKMLLLSYLQYEQIYSYRVVTDLVNHHCELKGLQTISESSVKHIMTTDNQFRTLVDSYRYGKKYFSDTILPHTVRNVTQFPANVWMIDGTPMQFYCWNSDRTKQVRMYLFAIIDVCSRKIVGFDIGYSETRFNILNALKLAVMSEGYLPSQIVSDNFSAGKTEEIIDLKNQMAKLGVSWRNSKVGNAQDKSYIERFFGTFQSVECALYEGYIGEGITSKRNNRPNAEFLQKMAKKNGLLMPNEMKSQIATMIAKYNERSIGGRKSPNEVCSSFDKPNAVPMDAVRTALLFWSKTSTTIKRGMVKFKVNKVQHTFEIKEHQTKAELQGKKVAIRYNENDLDWIMLFDYNTDTAICECKASIKAELLAPEDPKSKEVSNIIKSEAKKKSYHNYLKNQTQKIIDKGLEHENEDNLELVHPLSLQKNQVNTKESEDFLELYYNENGITKDAEYQLTKKPIKTILHSGVKDFEELLIKKSSS